MQIVIKTENVVRVQHLEIVKDLFNHVFNLSDGIVKLNVNLFGTGQIKHFFDQTVHPCRFF